MGNLATPEALVLRWDEVLKDPSMALGTELSKQLAGGVCISECSMLTRIGIRVPGVAWASAAFMAAQREQTPYGRAPEICIEILRSNVAAELEEKRAAYLEAGAHEVWLVAEDGGLRYFDRSGEKSKSSFPVDISLPPPMDEYR